MNLENVKAGDKIRFTNGTAEPTQEREVERVTKTQVICLDKDGKKQPGSYATKFNKVTGRQVGDWVVPYFVLSIVEHEPAPVVEETPAPCKTIAFNTGRQYSTNGQRIIARATPHGDVIFSDLDRNVFGIICNISLEKSAIVKGYDDGAYNYCKIPPEMDPYHPECGTYYESILNPAPVADETTTKESTVVFKHFDKFGCVLIKEYNGSFFVESYDATGERVNGLCVYLSEKEAFEQLDIEVAKLKPAPIKNELLVTFQGQSLARIVRTNSGFKCFADLVSAIAGYRPSLDCTDPKLEFLADTYDAHQKAVGDPRRAFRYGSEAIKKERKAQTRGKKASFTVK